MKHSGQSFIKAQ